MIHDGFVYLGTLMLLAAILVNLPVYLKGKGAQKFFKFAPPIVLIYLGMMVLCTLKIWNLEDTAATYKAVKNPLLYDMLLLVGVAFFISAISKDAGDMVASVLPVFDKATWTVLLVTAVGLIAAMTPFGKLKGTEEVSNIILYIEIALIASRADISAMGNAPAWLAAGFLILLIHVAVMIVLAKVIKLDIFTCAVASLANIGGTATAPVLAGAYSSALVPVGILMALLGNIIGTPGGAFMGHLMSMIG